MKGNKRREVGWRGWWGGEGGGVERVVGWRGWWGGEGGGVERVGVGPEAKERWEEG